MLATCCEFMKAHACVLTKGCFAKIHIQLLKLEFLFEIKSLQVYHNAPTIFHSATYKIKNNLGDKILATFGNFF